MTEPTPQPPVRVLVAEDVDVVRDALVALLGTAGDLLVVATAARGDEVLDRVRASSPDVAVLDVDLPGMSGIDAAAEVTREVPQCRVLCLTALAGVGHLQRAMDAGVMGYLRKTVSGLELIDGVRTVAAGGLAVDPDLFARWRRTGACPLTGRELDVLRLTLDGLRSKAIAANLFLSAGTVRNCASSAMAKLGAETRYEAALAAQREGWI